MIGYFVTPNWLAGAVVPMDRQKIVVIVVVLLTIGSSLLYGAASFF